MTCQQPHSPMASGLTATRSTRRRSKRPCPFSHRAWSSGGKSLLGEPAFGFVQNPALVAFQAEAIVAAQFLSDEACALLLAVPGVGGDPHARRRVDFFEQRFRSEEHT